jgi:hypothetical protein
MAYQSDKKTNLFGILGVAILFATPIVYLLYSIAVYA